MKESLAGGYLSDIGMQQMVAFADFPTLLEVVGMVNGISSEMQGLNAELSGIINRAGAYSNKFDPTPHGAQEQKTLRTPNEDTALALLGQKLRVIETQLGDYRQEVNRLNAIIGQ